MNQKDQQFDNDQETLVAYLDGELNEGAAIEVELRLASDIAFRRQLQELEKTWDMLDALPEVEPTESFTRSTMEMVISNATREAQRRSRKFWTLPIQVFVLTAIPAMCFFGAYYFLQWRNEAPLRDLVEQFPLLQNYELYESVVTVDFAEMLEQEGLFQQFIDDESEEGGLPAVWTATRATIVDLDTDQRGNLRRQKDRFELLSAAEQKTFRDIHTDVSGREDRVELVQTMRQYDQWLQEIGRDRMVAVQSEPPAKRIEKIRSIQREMQQSMYGNLDKNDKELVFQWFEKLVTENASAIRKQIADATQAKKPWTRIVNSRWPPEAMIRVMMRYDPDRVVELVSDEKFADLLSQLSSRSREIIDEKPTEVDQRRYVLMLNLEPYVSEERLREFYRSDLSPEQRDELDNMATAELLTELRQRYFKHKYRSMFPRGSRTNNQ